MRMKGRIAARVVKGIPTAIASPYPVNIARVTITQPNVPSMLR